MNSLDQVIAWHRSLDQVRVQVEAMDRFGIPNTRQLLEQIDKVRGSLQLKAGQYAILGK